MIEEIKKNKWLILLLMTGAVYFFLKYIVPLTAPILVALLFVTIFGPFLQKLERGFRIPRQVGAVLLLCLGGVLLALLLWILATGIRSCLPEWVDWMMGLEQYLDPKVFRGVREALDWIQKEWLPGMLTKSITYLGAAASAFAMLIVFAISALFLAKEYDALMNRLIAREECHRGLDMFCEIIRYISTYVKAQMIILSCIGFLAAVVLLLCGVRHGTLLGILAGLLDALPFLGTGIVLVPIIVIRLIEGEYVTAVVCVVLYLSCIALREYMEPKLIGRRVGMSPLVILISIYVGVRLFGIWGIVEGPLGFILLYQSYRCLFGGRRDGS